MPAHKIEFSEVQLPLAQRAYRTVNSPLTSDFASADVKTIWEKSHNSFARRMTLESALDGAFRLLQSTTGSSDVSKVSIASSSKSSSRKDIRRALWASICLSLGASEHETYTPRFASPPGDAKILRPPRLVIKTVSD